MNELIVLKDINKEYDIGSEKLRILKNINVNIKKGEFVAIMGASGSGKSTLLNIIGCLDRPSSGSYIFNGKSVDIAKSDELALIRNREIGFVFQSFNLIPYYSAIKNVEVPLSYSNGKNRRELAEKLLQEVGLGHRLFHKPSLMSGGERQRVAIARALITNPDLILADEPTGALDSKSGEEVMRMFEKMHNEGKTIILVTHDLEVAKHAQRIIHVKDGVVIDELY